MQIRRLTTFSLLFAAGAAAGCTTDNTGGADPDADPAVPYPATCKELQAGNLSLSDAEYTLYVKNDAMKPWRAYCQNMSTSTPAEYLTLRRTGGDYNYGEFVQRTSAGQTSVRTSYIKLRIDPILMQIDIGDRTQASSNGQTMFQNVMVNEVAFGVAAFCATPPIAIGGGEDPKATGNIDLSGTHFVLADSFCVHNSQTGFAVQSSDHGRLDFAARIPSAGAPFPSVSCAWVAPDPCPVDPWQPTTRGGLLNIEYSP
ncbi:MAG TPA: GON domain-containing protein [Kofleriaceae bacterium]|nr:GON domain-containing protein [Kofleriaceae bacterium]